MTEHKRPTEDQSVPVWPTLEEQLVAAKVIPGSALERVIRENQDHTMLDPSENPNDIWKLPLWLRVYFRKQHPELEFTGPGVGYPLALKELHEWMLHNQDLPTHRG